MELLQGKTDAFTLGETDSLIWNKYVWGSNMIVVYKAMNDIITEDLAN